MGNDFEQIDKKDTELQGHKDIELLGHKNIELLRFYIGKDISKIDKKIQDGESSLLGYFIASLVDILIVLLFDQGMDEFLKTLTDKTLWIVLSKIACVFILLGLFLLVLWLVKWVCNLINIRSTTSGKKAYKVKYEQQIKIDNFDNIACDGLLICQHYIQRYRQTDDDEGYVKQFYLFEIIHHLEKARVIFTEIYKNRNLYIAAKENAYNPELISTYRINNFIIFAKQILSFLMQEIPEDSGNEDLDRDMKNLKGKIQKWELFE